MNDVKVTISLLRHISDKLSVWVKNVSEHVAVNIRMGVFNADRVSVNLAMIRTAIGYVGIDSLDQMFLVSSTQIIMAAALILGIITTFILLYRLCAATANLQPVGTRPNYESRLSIGSLQIYVEERLRDAPPRYTRTAPAGSSVYPASAYLNAGFIHDSSVPPPAYTPSTKPRDTQSETLHI
ncbi:hypothetical protein RR48_12425 [Papilio machaon]|uniref:Uncharacterized protein n=1 Tax=Papilio machaon TaxID=76193 RepID=A0A194RNC1_PAPMA|nr:hypothetical protein RR48_12425 [Papilio machaon]